jgi:hypothetical protein
MVAALAASTSHSATRMMGMNMSTAFMLLYAASDHWLPSTSGMAFLV